MERNVMNKEAWRWAVVWFAGTVFISIVFSVLHVLVPGYAPWWFALLPLALVPTVLGVSALIFGTIFVVVTATAWVLEGFGIELFGE
jgi:hypothetical protein